MLQPEAAPVLSSTKRYVIERELGQGGMGVVYQALDLERRTRVALKAISHRDAITIYRLKNEFRQLADLSHPNLVTLHELCNEGAAWFFTMELVNGSPFDQYCNTARSASIPPEAEPARRLTASLRFLRDASITLGQRKIGSELPLRRSTCNMRRLRNALRQLVEGIAALHDAGKLHRDLKPSNVLVTPEGRVVVLDFGLVSNGTFIDAASQEAERTVGGSMFGTPAYMSPEQAAGETVTPASDWYSVGTMLYEALTGELPFDGTVVEILRRKDELEPPPPSELVTGVPDDLDFLCRELLHRDPQRRPNAADLLRYLTGHSAPPPAYDAQSSPRVPTTLRSELFVGRNEHMAALRDAFETAKRGTPVTVLVHGLSGIGKSALVRCFANELIRAEEAVVLRGRCYERENVPYKAFDNIVDALSRYLMRLPAQECAEILPRNAHALAVLFPVLRRVKAIAVARRPKAASGDAREQRNQAFAALKELLLRISDFHPLVINIDDLQWADIDSARLLSFLLGPPDPPPLLLVGTYRRDEVLQSPFLTQILSERGLGAGGAQLRDLPVDALTHDEGEELASALLADAHPYSGLLHGAIAAEGEGVPFFITELVQHVRLRGGHRGLTESSEPVSLEQVLRDRIASMPLGAQRLLEVLSMAGGPIEQGVAIDAAGLIQGDRSALLALRAARLIRTRGTRESDTAETYHDRVRETVAAGLESETAREIHARIALALERHDVHDPDRLVLHFTGAGNGMRAGETAVEAADRAAEKLAFSRAAALYARALELLAPDSARRGELYERLGEMLTNAGRGSAAAEAYLKAAEGRDGSDARRLHRLATQQYLRSGRLDVGLELAASAFREVGMKLPASGTQSLASYAWHKLLLSAAGTGADYEEEGGSTDDLTRERLATLDATFREIGMVDLVRGAALQAQFLRHALRARDTERVMHGLAWQAWNAAMTQRSGIAARKILDRMDALAERKSTPYVRASALHARAGCSLLQRRMGEVLAPATEAERLFREQCAGSHWEQNIAAVYRYTAIEQTGGFKAVLEEVPIRAREAEGRDDRFGSAILTLFMSFSQLAADQPQEALRFLEQERARHVGAYGAFDIWCGIRTAHALLYSREYEHAYRHVLDQVARFSASSVARGRFYRATLSSLLVRCSLAARPHDRAVLRTAERHARELLALQQPQAEALGLMHLADVAQRRGDVRGAVEHLESCAWRGDALHAPMLALYAQRTLGTLIGGERGRALVEGCDARLRAEGVLAPESWARIWIESSAQ